MGKKVEGREMSRVRIAPARQVVESKAKRALIYPRRRASAGCSVLV